MHCWIFASAYLKPAYGYVLIDVSSNSIPDCRIAGVRLNRCKTEPPGLPHAVLSSQSVLPVDPANFSAKRLHGAGPARKDFHPA